MAIDTEELLSDYHASDLSQKAFCAKRKIALSTFHYHLSKFHKNKANKNRRQKNGYFVPLVAAPKEHSKQKTLLFIRGDISLSEIAALYRSFEE